MIRNLFKFLFRVFFWICGIAGFFLLGLLAMLYFIGLDSFLPSSKPLKQDSVLTVTLDGPYVEHTTHKELGALLLGKTASLYDLTKAITHAAQNPKIKGLVVRLASPQLGAAQLQELRDALLVFRKTGKPSWCYADSFGETSSGTGHYYLATACEEIWLQPLGSFNLTGLQMEVPFAKKALEKLQVKPEIAQRKEYKSFPEMFTREDFSEANREALQAILDSILSQYVDGIAKERKLTHDQVRLLINNGPYFTQEAQAEKLVDNIDFRQNLNPMIREKLGADIAFVGVKKYLKTLPHEEKKDKVALIFGSGTIQRDGDNSSPLDEVKIGSTSTYEAFQSAIEDNDVKAIVYRINSGGGSPTASETIYGIIEFAKTKNKPVIISMSDAAASGGYWIAAAGSKIVAQPATLTGSIGVFGGKFVLSGLFEKLGIKWGQIFTGENSSMWSMNESYSPAQWVKYNKLMDQVYEAFTYRVAKNRKMTPVQVEKVARGRVWTGEQALALGLVDQLGSLHSAIDLAKKEAGLLQETSITIYPKEKTLLESLVSLLDSDEDKSGNQMGVLGGFLSPFKKIFHLFSLLFFSQEVLYTPIGEIK